MNLTAFPPMRVVKAGFSNETIKRRFREHEKTSPYYNFQFAFSGTGICIVEDTPYSLRAGMGIFIYPLERYIFRNRDENFGQFFCHFDICGNENTASPDIFRTKLGDSRIVEPEFFSMVEHCREVLHYTSQQLENASNSLSASGWFMVMMGQVLQNCLKADNEEYPLNPETRSAVRKGQRYIEQHFSEIISVKELAKSSGLSAGYFSKLFTAETSFTPHQYVLHCRIEYAKLRLSENTSPIKDIAENAGFREPAHFNHTFKKWTGLTPASYRKQSLFGSENASTDIRD